MKISIVLATYNGAYYVEELIRSVLNNTTPPDEWIIIDDRSSDHTPELVLKCLTGHANVHLTINEQNVGAAKSFIKGTLGTTGDVVFFADQDDVWHADKIERMTRPFERTKELTMTYCDGIITNDKLIPQGETIFSTRKRARLEKGSAREPMDIAGNPDVKGCTAALRGDFLRELFAKSDPSFAEYWGHDHWSALFAYGMGLTEVIPEALLLHRFHAANTSGAVKFDPWSIKHIRKHLRFVRLQRPDHFVRRYGVAIAHAERMGGTFSPALLDALRRSRAFEEERYRLREMKFLGRLRATWALQRGGIYRDHFNGMATWFRDLFL